MRPLERVILGPCRCQGCGGEVAWVHDGQQALGWLHEDGTFHCPRPVIRDRRAYNREWMRRYRRRAA